MVNLPKHILTATGILLSMLLVSCSIQKRTLRPGFHIERIGALNKKPSLRVQAQETANLPVLPNESVGLSFTPPATEAFAEDAENLNKLEDLAAVTPPQSIEPSSVQGELSPMPSDSTSTALIEGQVASSNREELLTKIAKAEKALNTINFLIFCPGFIAFGFPFWLFRSWKKSQISALRKEANLPYKLAWYNTPWFFITCTPFTYPVLPFALACRLIDQHRLKREREPLSWISKTVFFTLLFLVSLLLFFEYGSISMGGFGSFSWI